MSRDKKITIDLSNIRAKKYHNQGKDKNIYNHILLEDYYKKIVQLILDRINEIEHYKRYKFDIDNINEVKMHDAILVYGSRGNGKSTIMINLQDFITGDYKIKEAEKLDSRVKIFNTIDPTIQEEDEDFLLVILSTILKEVEEAKQNKYLDRDGFYESLEKVLNIVEATRSKKKDDIDIFDKFYGLKSGVGLAEELHKLFKYTKDIFDVDILIIPIDDVDMNLKQGYQIADSIRKYMSSPYIIPIVAFNIRQMKVVTKYNKYKEFGLKIDSEIDTEELSFLRSLPNDYLSKIFPPNRRIYLKSVFEILQESKLDNIIFKKDDIELHSLDMITLISELFYEYHYNKYSFGKIDSSTFLSNRSMRNFLNDCYCVLSSLESKIENNGEIAYKINRKVIKDRLAPDDRNAFVTKEHALTWLWNDYIDVAKKNLDSSNSRLKNYNWAKMVTETLPEDTSAEIINNKTYTRVWLQKYYRIDEKLIEKDNQFIHNKTCDIVGTLELAMRSYIPMYLFESIVKNRNLKYDSSDLIYLRNFSSKSLLEIAYELSMMEMSLYKGEHSGFEPKPVGSLVVNKNFEEITDKKFNIPFLFKILNQDKLNNSGGSSQLYVVSIFKAIAFFIELSKIYKQSNKEEDKSDLDLEIIALIERYRVNMPNINKNENQESAVEMKTKYFEECIENIGKYSFKTKLEIKEETKEVIKNYILDIEFEKSNFGILEIAKFSKRLVDFFMNVRDNINKPDLTSFITDNEKREETKEFYLPLITYFTSFTQSLFISMFNSIKEDDLLAIKRENGGDKIISRKNSLYGTSSNHKADDHLYEANICNLKEIVESHNPEDKKIQKDFYELFKFINEVPFFKLLISKSEFLPKLKKESKNASS